MKKITNQTRFYLSIILLNICSNIFSMQKEMPQLPIPNLSIEKKQKLIAYFQEYTEVLRRKIKEHESTNPNNIYYQEEEREIKCLQEQILNNCIFHGLEDWFTKGNIKLVKNILNESTGFNPRAITFLSWQMKLEKSDFIPEFKNYYGSRFEDIAILRAIRLKQINIAIKLISSGYVNVKITEKNTQQTPLHLAVLTGNIPLVRLLLIQGANPTAYDNSYPYDISYLTPLDYANRMAQMPDINPEMKENMQAIIKLLLAAANKQ